ncbi:MAG: NAD(P)/FAD-dependent oxidoreductase [Lachnospiraceae bacterium]|nr:NAD(P)/FAD-dependent oxidoreductase [Lachnospiraceae bacterium]
MRYDVAIIGTGPAGLEAAITLTIRKKNIILIGKKNSSSKVRSAEKIDNYLGIPSVSGDDLARKMLDHAASMGVEITEGRATLIYPYGEYFGIQCGEEMIEATSVILATGVAPANTLPGENEFLGRGVSYCATCDAAMYKEKKALVISYSKDYEEEAEFLKKYASEVIYIPAYKEDEKNAAALTDVPGISVMNAKPLEIKGGFKANTLVTDQGEIQADGIFILRDQISAASLVPGLETEGGNVKCARDMSTSVPGLYAAGDIAGAPYQLIKAAGEGLTAALSAVKYLVEKK